MEANRAQSLLKVSADGERHLPVLDPESINHYRHMTAYHFVLPFARGAAVLDYGCGTGYGTNFLWRRGDILSVLGVDPSEDAIAYCRESYGDLSEAFHVVQAEEVPFPDSTFDLVLLFQVLEHVQDDVSLLRELRRCLRLGGLLFITTPNVKLSTGDPDHRANPHHVREYSVQRLRAVCTSVFPLVEQFGVHASFRAGGRGVGIERSIAYRALRKLTRGFLPRPMYVAPVSLADFSITARRVAQALDLLFVCRRPP